MLNNNVISIVGYSNSGKTTLIEKLIPLFKENGYKVGTIKHIKHNYEIDINGKDSWRHQTAGANETIVFSNNQFTLISKTNFEIEIDYLINFLKNSDIIIIEGYKKINKPKIEVFRPSISPKPAIENDNNLIAYVTDDLNYKFKSNNTPILNLNDIKQIFEFIINFLKKGVIK